MIRLLPLKAHVLALLVGAAIASAANAATLDMHMRQVKGKELTKLLSSAREFPGIRTTGVLRLSSTGHLALTNAKLAPVTPGVPIGSNGTRSAYIRDPVEIGCAALSFRLRPAVICN